MEPLLKTKKVVWTGVRPLVLHCGMLADPTNPFVIAIKKLTAKKAKKTDFDNEEIARLEWMGSLYLAENKKTLVIPSDNIECAIKDGARKSRLGKDVEAAVFCAEPEIEINHADLKGKTPEQLYNDPSGKFVLRKGVKVQKNRVIRVRAMVPTNWSLSFTVEYDESIINARALDQAMSDAGSLVGLGDWRPKFGRFVSEVVS